MLKGKAKIELTNVKTGEKETYESENMITNYVKDCLTPNYNWYEPYRYSWSRTNSSLDVSTLINWFFQGIALWDTTLEEDPDKYYFPNDAECIGRGDNSIRDTAESTAGSFNSRESITTLDSRNIFKYVWDFGTSQAVGTFSALSLLPTKNARILPVPSNTLTVCDNDSSAYYIDCSGTYPNNGTFIMNYSYLINNIVANNNYPYYNQQLKINSNGNIYYANINLSNNQIDIYEFIPPLNILDIRDGFGKNTSSVYYNKYTKIYHLQLSQELQNQLPESYSYSYQFNNKQLIILINPNTHKYLSSNETLGILTLDLNSLSNPNFQYTEISNFVDENYYFYNTSQAGNNEVGSYSTGNNYTEWILTDNFIIYMTFRPNIPLSTNYILFYIQMADVKIKLFDIKNKTSKDITFYNKKGLGLNSSNTGEYMHCFGFYCFFTFNDNIHFRYFNEQQSNYYIPCNKSKIYYASNMTNINNLCGFRMPETSNGYIAPNNYFFKSDDTNNCNYFPFAISTINNLETPITKGNDQVMKITYTLTLD